MGTSGFDQALTKCWDWNNKGVSRKLSFVTEASADSMDSGNGRTFDINMWTMMRNKVGCCSHVCEGELQLFRRDRSYLFLDEGAVSSCKLVLGARLTYLIRHGYKYSYK